jgi:hypothetical protein
LYHMLAIASLDGAYTLLHSVDQFDR